MDELLARISYYHHTYDCLAVFLYISLEQDFEKSYNEWLINNFVSKDIIVNQRMYDKLKTYMYDNYIDLNNVDILEKYCHVGAKIALSKIVFLHIDTIHTIEVNK